MAEILVTCADHKICAFFEIFFEKKGIAFKNAPAFENKKKTLTFDKYPFALQFLFGWWHARF